eukprot:1954278-Rhodomonas_salina.4
MPERPRNSVERHTRDTDRRTRERHGADTTRIKHDTTRTDQARHNKGESSTTQQGRIKHDTTRANQAGQERAFYATWGGFEGKWAAHSLELDAVLLEHGVVDGEHVE